MDGQQQIRHFGAGDIGVKGEMLQVDVRRQECHIQIDKSACIPINFDKEWESTVTDALRQHDTMRLWVRGQGEFAPDGALQRITGGHSCLLMMAKPPPNPNRRSIWEVMDEIAANVPEQERGKLPTDLSHRHDYYIYGIEDAE